MLNKGSFLNYIDSRRYVGASLNVNKPNIPPLLGMLNKGSFLNYVDRRRYVGGSLNLNNTYKA